MADFCTNLKMVIDQQWLMHKGCEDEVKDMFNVLYVTISRRNGCYFTDFVKEWNLKFHNTIHQVERTNWWSCLRFNTYAVCSVCSTCEACTLYVQPYGIQLTSCYFLHSGVSFLPYQSVISTAQLFWTKGGFAVKLQRRERERSDNRGQQINSWKW